MLQLTFYADWSAKEVTSRSAHARLRTDWIPNWKRTLTAIKSANGIFELISNICARWEFLGSLYLGSTGDTGVREAIEYVVRFLVPINSDYKNLHNISGKASAGTSEFFTVFRNKPLHGGTPAAIALTGANSVIGWLIGLDKVTNQNHLRIANGVMHVDGGRLLTEFLSSLEQFASYLESNQEVFEGKSPQARWQRGFWARFRPVYFPEQNWMPEGLSRGIPI